MSFQPINPANGEVLATYEEMKPDQLPGLIGKVHDAFLSWRRTSFDDRAKLMRQAAQVLRKNQVNTLV
jgi:succinate-semialdehyde dehydrogenase/glutarate-semialdehyde dehydrogenase